MAKKLPGPEDRHASSQVLVDPEESARLLQAIKDGFADIERGDHMDAFEFVAKLRAKRDATHR
jgi:predicted transcriptional regulator